LYNKRIGREETKSTPVEYSASRVWIVRKENVPKLRCNYYYDPIREKRRCLNLEVMSYQEKVPTGTEALSDRAKGVGKLNRIRILISLTHKSKLTSEQECTGEALVGGAEPTCIKHVYLMPEISLMLSG